MIAALVLVAGPWTDEAAELAGWDIERFLAIARDGGRAWSGTAVEYPPGSVVIFEGLNGFSPSGAPGLVAAHRLLVALALASDLAVARLLHLRNRRAGLAYLLLGLPLVPMGLLRLDIISTLPAVAGALLVAVRPTPEMSRPDDVDPGHGSATFRPAAAGVLVAVGAMIKLWPILLLPAMWSVRRERAAVAGVAACAAATLVWLWWAGAGLEPVDQVVSLRGATGWQLESVGGVATALSDAVGVGTLDPDEGVRLELNAFRIGTLSPLAVAAGRVLAAGAIIALAWRARRSSVQPNPSVVGAVMLGSTAALIVTSPLLSPQFLLWLTPWAALVLAGTDQPRRPIPTPVLLTAAAALATGVVLTVFGPPDLANPIAAAILAVRNGLLIALPISCWRWLGRVARESAE